MNITVGPSICFGFDFKREKEMKFNINDVITDIKNIAFSNETTFEYETTIDKETLNVEKITNLIRESLRFYELEEDFIIDDIKIIIIEIYTNETSNEINVDLIINKLNKYFDDSNFFDK